MKKIIYLFIFMTTISLSCNNQEKETSGTDNPLLVKFDTPFGVPPFEQIKPEHYMPAFEEGMKQQLEEVQKIIDNTEEPTFANTVEAMFRSGELLNQTSAIFFSQDGANTNKELQKVAQEISPKLAAHRDAISLNPKLFERIKLVYAKKDSFQLTDEQAFLFENMYKGFIRNGANLPDDKKEELKAINQKLSSLSVQFDQNLLAETNDFKLIIDNKDDLAGLPEDVIGAAAETAAKDSLEGKWVFTTHKPSMIPFLQYANNRDLREKLYYAYTHRGNNGNQYDNKQIVADIVKLRVEKAKLLGYPNHAAYRLENRMAKTPERAFELLNKLWDKALPAAKKEAGELQKMIDAEGGKFKLASWDWWYYAEKLRKQKYDLDENEMRPYFKLENVREGAFTVANKLYGITFTEINDIPKPHPDAQAFEVKEANGDQLCILYMDFYPRESKNGGAWCGGYREHEVIDGKEIKPIVTVVCNFTKPTGDKPSLVSPDEASTLFHEFGHALDGLFAKTTYSTSYTAWDFVELPSQIMEHWAFEPEVLKMYAKQYKTDEVIPDALIEKIKNSGQFNQGFETVEYLAASMLDLAYHTITEPKDLDVIAFEKDYLDGIGLISEIEPRYHTTYFAHIIGGYDAGYYSYIWAGVLDNDAFEAFKETNIFDKTTAEKFRKNVLELNGIKDALEMYIAFRGKEASIEPLLKNRGLE
ncbi:MAG: M3 family metallopeptidase [Bacteroidales bacterium]|nr:M3 family metallopeptidase [Bacteroidales bacterium]